MPPGVGSIVLDLWKNRKGSMEHYGPKRVSCDNCRGSGWIKKSNVLDEWAQHCSLCGGKGELSLHLIANAIEEDPGVLYRLFHMRVRPKTARRLLDKLLTFSSLEA